jgi:dipeptidyl aminopeptidase/acylaminoacyl peptidase
MRRTLLLTLAATTLAAPASAQTAPPKRPMTFADLQAMHRIADPQISPSGKWVLFSVTDVSLANNTKINHLWIVPLDGSSKEHQLTTGSGESNGRFSPDGKSVLYSADDQLSLAPWDDATGTLAPAHAVTSLATGADGGLWAPDSKHILFTSSVYPGCESHAPAPQRFAAEATCNSQKEAVANKSLVKAQIFDHLLYRHWNQYVGPKHSHIFYASVDGGTPEDLTPASVVGDHEAPTFSLGGPLGYAISPDGKEIAYEVNLDKVPAQSTNNDIFILQLGAAPSTAKKVSTSPGSDDGPQYSPDGKWLAWRSQARAGFESDKFRLMVVDRASGKITDELPRFDGWVDEFAWGSDSHSIIFASAQNGAENVFQLALSDGVLTRRTDGTRGFEMSADADLARDGEHLQGGEYASLVPSPDGKLIIATMMSVRASSEVVSLTVADRDEYDDTITRVPRRPFDGPATLRNVLAGEQRLTHLNDHVLNTLDLPKMESFTFAGANGTEVQGFLIRPPNFDPSKKYPLKFLIHGGPQGAWGDAWSYRWNPELFAANGYVVVMINPRGSTGYGQQFVDEVSGDWGGRPYFDLMKGLDYVEDKYPFIDKHRECALGASYGGFMADYILTHTDRFACIVTHDGMYNPQSAFGTTEELWFNEWEFRPLVGTGPHAVVDQTHPAHPWDFYNLPADQDPFRKFSPMLSIDNAKTPTLVIHGQKDYRLDLSEGLQLFDALQIRGVPSKMLYFPDEGHWVLKPQTSQLWYQTVNDWVDQWTHTNAYEKK